MHFRGPHETLHWIFLRFRNPDSRSWGGRWCCIMMTRQVLSISSPQTKFSSGLCCGRRWPPPCGTWLILLCKTAPCFVWIGLKVINSLLLSGHSYWGFPTSAVLCHIYGFNINLAPSADRSLILLIRPWMPHCRLLASKTHTPLTSPHHVWAWPANRCAADLIIMSSKARKML